MCDIYRPYTDGDKGNEQKCSEPTQDKIQYESPGDEQSSRVAFERSSRLLVRYEHMELPQTSVVELMHIWMVAKCVYMSVHVHVHVHGSVICGCVNVCQWYTSAYR